MINLVKNAIEHTSFKGEVLVNSYYDQTKKKLLFVVEDTGIGIQKDDQETLFEMIS